MQTEKISKSVGQSETWKLVVGYEGVYSISNYGRVCSERYDKRILKTSMCGGYRTVTLCVNNSPKTFLVAHLVARAFIGPRPERFQVNHKDLNKLNNKAENLEYLSQIENIRHARANKYWGPQGEKNNFSKLTKKQVISIISRYAKGNIFQSDLAKIYNVCQSNISKITREKSWKHIQMKY